MKPPFLSRRVRLFGNVAVVLLVAVAFMIPFALRGARMGLLSIKNDVKDWLPGDFPETAELDWFAKHFLGDAFVVATWPGCTEDDPRLHTLASKIREESMSLYPPINVEAPEGIPLHERPAEERARYWADKFGLYYAGDYYLDWAGRNEKWLAGSNDHWYFITPNGEFYQWDAEPDLVSSASRSIHRAVTRNKAVDATLIDRLGDAAGVSIYADPRRLMTRLFQDVQTGPELLAQLAKEEGSLRTGVGREQVTTEQAQQLARQRLSGLLFGPEPPPRFNWTEKSFVSVVGSQQREQLPEDWQSIFHDFVGRLTDSEFDGSLSALQSAPQDQQAQYWDDLFRELDVQRPAPLTCLLVTLSPPTVEELGLALSRPMLGRPPGRILQLAMDSGIDADELRLGGPPVDNVAIDQESTITLVRLIGLSVVVGTTLAYICLGSHLLTCLVQLVGMISAVASLGIVWWSGDIPDAVSMSMPPLVYVLGLSGAVHIVNYYRDAVREKGLLGVPETALRLGWFPCTLAAFTTSLGLMSLNVSNIIPIKRFGFFSAIGVMATLLLLLGFLPAALQIWAPQSKRDKKYSPDEALINRLWSRVGKWIIKRHWQVATACTLLLFGLGLGLRKIETSVQLLNLFDSDARLIQDYVWLEENLCKLVPMEIVARVDPEAQRPPLEDLESGRVSESDFSSLQLDFLECAELIGRIQQFVQREFGEEGQRIVGSGMSAAMFLPPFPGRDGGGFSQRSVFNGVLEERRDDLFEADFVQLDPEDDRELWRLSLRAVALEDVDYGQFVSDLKTAIEPILAGYRYRNKIFSYLQQNGEPEKSSVYVLGFDPRPPVETPPAVTKGATRSAGGEAPSRGAVADKGQIGVDQTRIFAQTLDDLLHNRGFRRRSGAAKMLDWHDPHRWPISDDKTRNQFAAWLSRFDCVVLADDHPSYDLDFIRKHAKHLVDARDHQYDPSQVTALTAAERIEQGDQHTTISVVYTGIVPIVYKAQHALLESLINSIGLAFVMISGVMMMLLRDWKRTFGPSNLLNVRAGMVSMLPNVFPVAMIFGTMGHLGIKVDIGSMMTASVAMGVAVDDTIHFLNWFRKGLREGLSRPKAILVAYRRCATAMTQTTLIGGLGLAVFGFSSFTPTQQFGVLMLLLLSSALLGDRTFLPALLAGPLGRYFEVQAERVATTDPAPTWPVKTGAPQPSQTLHSSTVTPRRRSSTTLRPDTGHDTLGQ